MVVELGVQHPLGEGLLEPVQQASVGQGGPRIRSGQKLVQQLIRDRRLFAARHTIAPSAASYGPKHGISDSPARWSPMASMTSAPTTAMSASASTMIPRSLPSTPYDCGEKVWTESGGRGGGRAKIFSPQMTKTGGDGTKAPPSAGARRQDPPPRR